MLLLPDLQSTIASVKAFNPQNETIYDVSGRMFSDCTGDGSLGYLAGASYRVGAEETTLYGEKFAPDKTRYGELMGHSILFYTKDTGAPVKFVAPQFLYGGPLRRREGAF